MTIADVLKEHIVSTFRVEGLPEDEINTFLQNFGDY
jgi:hypothetical protein